MFRNFPKKFCQTYGSFKGSTLVIRDWVERSVSGRVQGKGVGWEWDQGVGILGERRFSSRDGRPWSRRPDRKSLFPVTSVFLPEGLCPSSLLWKTVRRVGGNGLCVWDTGPVREVERPSWPRGGSSPDGERTRSVRPEGRTSIVCFFLVVSRKFWWDVSYSGGGFLYSSRSTLFVSTNLWLVSQFNFVSNLRYLAPSHLTLCSTEGRFSDVFSFL